MGNIRLYSLMPPEITSYKQNKGISRKKLAYFLMHLQKFFSYTEKKDLIITSVISLETNTRNHNEQCYNLHAESRGKH